MADERGDDAPSLSIPNFDCLVARARRQEVADLLGVELGLGIDVATDFHHLQLLFLLLLLRLLILYTITSHLILPLLQHFYPVLHRQLLQVDSLFLLLGGFLLIVAEFGNGGACGAVVGWCPETSCLIFTQIVIISHLYRLGAFKICPGNTVYHISMSLHHMHDRIDITVAIRLFDQVKVPNNDVFVLRRRRKHLRPLVIDAERRVAYSEAANPVLVALRELLDAEA